MMNRRAKLYLEASACLCGQGSVDTCRKRTWAYQQSAPSVCAMSPDLSDLNMDHKYDEPQNFNKRGALYSVLERLKPGYSTRIGEFRGGMDPFVAFMPPRIAVKAAHTDGTTLWPRPWMYFWRKRGKNRRCYTRSSKPGLKYIFLLFKLKACSTLERNIHAS